jgi:sRNA-binding carbon storage regulator CsrA
MYYIQLSDLPTVAVKLLDCPASGLAAVDWRKAHGIPPDTSNYIDVPSSVRSEVVLRSLPKQHITAEANAVLSLRDVAISADLAKRLISDADVLDEPAWIELCAIASAQMEQRFRDAVSNAVVGVLQKTNAADWALWNGSKFVFTGIRNIRDERVRVAVEANQQVSNHLAAMAQAVERRNDEAAASATAQLESKIAVLTRALAMLPEDQMTGLIRRLAAESAGDAEDAAREKLLAAMGISE